MSTWNLRAGMVCGSCKNFHTLPHIHQLKICGFESCCSHLNFRFCTCLEQGVPWHSCNYGVWIHSETRMWHSSIIWSVWLNGLWVQVPLQLPKNLTVNSFKLILLHNQNLKITLFTHLPDKITCTFLITWFHFKRKRDKLKRKKL